MVKSEEKGSAKVEIFTADGRKVESQMVEVGLGTAKVDVSHLPSGFYIAKAADNNQNKVACKFMK